MDRGRDATPEGLLDDDLESVFTAALEAVGGTLIALYSPELLRLLGGDGRASLYVAADVGLGLIAMHVESGQTKAIADWTPWPDVRDAEVHVETIAVEGGIHSTLRLTIQVPRVDVESGSLSQGLEKFAAAVLAHSGQK